MIKIENLSKVFKGKKGQKDVIALDNVSLVLPDKGFIFVTGKSGSGKSTLLNILGGLSAASNGRITVDSNELTKFKTKDFNKYRSSYVGFIFQDYHLINELTVKENIFCFANKKPSLSLEEILRIVDLEGTENRYPMQLSGGQKQRVAIARAISKDSKLILCDEPTGNLDKETSIQILNKLKEISKDRLVVIISHNRNDAEVYGDRIIELDEGRVILDITKTKDDSQKTEIIDGELKINYGQDISSVDIKKINEHLKENKIKSISQKDNGFEKTKDIEYVDKKTVIKKVGLGKKPFKTLFKSFFFANKGESILTILLTVLMVLVFSVIQALALFKTDVYLDDCVSRSGARGVVVYNSGNLTGTYRYPIIDSYDHTKKENKFKGNIYEAYRYSIFVEDGTPYTHDRVISAAYNSAQYRSSFYVRSSYGTYILDEQGLKYMLGQNNKLNVILGDINESKDTAKVIITDYVADCIVHYGKKYKSYESLIGAPLFYESYNCGEIAAIIDTGYKTKYKALIDLYNQILENKDDLDLKETYVNHPNFENFTEECMSQLNFCYTLNPNFKDAIVDFTYRDFTSLSGYYFEDSTISSQVSSSNGFVTRNFSSKYDVGKGEIVMSYGYYNSLFDADYTNKNYQTFTPRKVSLKLYDGNTTSNTVIYEKEITIKALHNTSGAYMAMHDDDIKEFIKMNVYKDYLFVAEGENRADLLKAFEDRGYSIAITTFSTIISLHSFVDKFGPFFWMLVILFIVLILFYLITFSIKGIMRYKYQIGILKALGADTITLSNIFVTKMGIIASVIAGASISGIILFTNKIDQILVQAVHDVLRRTFDGLSIVTLKPEVLLIDILFILVIIIVSALLPIFIMRSIKPVDILRERE